MESGEMADNRAIVHSSRRLTIGLVLAGVLVVGCQPGQQGGERPPVADDLRTVNVYEIAQALGLKVTDITSTHFTLKNPANIVMIFTYPGGHAYVNAKSIGEVGDVAVVDGSTRLPGPLIGRIRNAMQAYRETPIPTSPTASGRVVIDAGHGGKDPGAPAANGYDEKTINLQVAQKLRSILNARGVYVVMTREGDTFVELEERADVANRMGADLFVSLHADTASDRSVRGYTIYVADAAPWSTVKMAEAIENAMGAAGLSSRGVRRANYKVLVRTQGPAVLIEMGFISNSREAALLTDAAFQDRLAQAIADGICACLK